MKWLRAVVAAAAAAAMGICLAALPHTENDPCDEYRYLEEGAAPPLERSYFPLGYDCAPGDFLGPSVAATTAWMAGAGVLVAFALRRPTKVMRGALVGAATLSLMGAVYMSITPFAPVFMFTPVLMAPIAFAIAGVAGVALAPVLLFVWAFPYLLGFGDVANLVGIGTGAGGAWAIDRLGRRFGHLWRPGPQ